MATSNVSERPLSRTPDQLKKLLTKLDESGYKLDQLDELKKSAEKRADLIRQLKSMDPTLNGDAEQVVEDLGLYRQEVEAKKKWGVWEYVKSVPRRIWGTMKRHPYITAAIVIALGAAAAYYTGVGPIVISKLKTWLMSTAFGQKMAEMGGKVSAAAGEALGKGKELAGDAMGKGKELADKLPGFGSDAAPVAPSEPTAPVSPVAPESVIPNAKDGESFLEGLERTGA